MINEKDLILREARLEDAYKNVTFSERQVMSLLQIGRVMLGRLVEGGLLGVEDGKKKNSPRKFKAHDVHEQIMSREYLKLAHRLTFPQ